jgi:hypothetical protein
LTGVLGVLSDTQIGNPTLFIHRVDHAKLDELVDWARQHGYTVRDEAKWTVAGVDADDRPINVRERVVQIGLAGATVHLWPLNDDEDRDGGEAQ